MARLQQGVHDRHGERLYEATKVGKLRETKIERQRMDLKTDTDKRPEHGLHWVYDGEKAENCNFTFVQSYLEHETS